MRCILRVYTDRLLATASAATAHAATGNEHWSKWRLDFPGQGAVALGTAVYGLLQLGVLLQSACPCRLRASGAPLAPLARLALQVKFVSPRGSPGPLVIRFTFVIIQSTFRTLPQAAWLPLLRFVVSAWEKECSCDSGRHPTHAHAYD